MNLTSRYRPSCGQMRLTIVDDTICNNVDEYYTMEGVFADGICRNFKVSNSKLVCLKTGLYLFNGASDLEVDKSCIITYGLHVNDNLILTAQTPHTFTSAAKTDNISITAIVQFNKGDEIFAKVKSSVINTLVTINTFLITAYGGL